MSKERAVEGRRGGLAQWAGAWREREAFFFFKQKTAYEMLRSLVGSEMCIRDRRGLRVLEKQERNATLKGIINELAIAIEGGSTFSEGLAQHPKVFNRLFVNMVKAGELGGVLEVVLNRLSEFMEKAQKIKGKVVAAMFYPVAVLVVAVIILSILMVYVIPKFKEVFAGMLEGAQLPAFTRFVLAISDTIREHFVATLSILGGFVVLLMLFIRTKFGRRVFDKFKLKMPVVGPVINKVAISRFTRTLGTLVSSGVPILQALTIVKETAGNVIIANAVAAVHENVKEGETITAPLEASGVFPPMVCLLYTSPSPRDS